MKKDRLKDLRVRIISGVLALIIVVPLIVVGGIWFRAGICVVAALAYKELIDLKKSHGTYPMLILFLGTLSLMSLVLANTNPSIDYVFTYQLLALISLLLIVPLVFYKEENYKSKDAFYLLGITLFLGLIFNLFIIMREEGIGRFLFLFVIPMLNDIFAYLVGCKIGKHKMCVTISPKKTWEGAIGGLVLGTIGGLLIHQFMIGTINLKIVLVTMVLSIVGQIGDLVMSRIKRENEIKDFSNLMPGHGGILDRIDSTIFVFLAYIFLRIFL